MIFLREDIMEKIIIKDSFIFSKLLMSSGMFINYNIILPHNKINDKLSIMTKFLIEEDGNRGTLIATIIERKTVEEKNMIYSLIDDNTVHKDISTTKNIYVKFIID